MSSEDTHPIMDPLQAVQTATAILSACSFQRRAAEDCSRLTIAVVVIMTITLTAVAVAVYTAITHKKIDFQNATLCKLVLGRL